MGENPTSCSQNSHTLHPSVDQIVPNCVFRQVELPRDVLVLISVGQEKRLVKRILATKYYGK